MSRNFNFAGYSLQNKTYMKLKILTTVFFLLGISTNFFAQATWTTLLGETFHQTESFSDAVVTPDGNYIAVGSEMQPSGYTDWYLVKMSSSNNGDELWNKHFGKNRDDYANTVAATSDGFVVGGLSISKEDVYGDAMIAKFDWDGNKLWEVTWGDDFAEEIKDIVIAADGTIYAAGFEVTSVFDRSDYLMLKISADGTSVTQLDNGATTFGGVSYEKLWLDSDDVVYIEGILELDGAFHKLNAAGEIDITFELPLDYNGIEHLEFIDQKIIALVRDFSSGFKLVEYNTSGNIVKQSDAIIAMPIGNTGNPWLFGNFEIVGDSYKLSLVTDQEWTSIQNLSFSAIDLYLEGESDLSVPHEMDNTLSIIALEDGLLYCGAVWTSGQNDARAMKVDDSNSISWEKSYGVNGGAHTSLSGTITAANNDGYLVQYLETTEDDSDVVITKIDDDGTMLWKSTVPLENQQFSFAGISETSDGLIYTMLMTAGEAPTVVKLDNTGSVIWMQELSNEMVISFKLGLQALPDGGVAISYGVADNSMGFRLLPQYCRLAADGTILEDKNIDLNFERMDIRDMTLSNDGNLIVVGGARELSTDVFAPFIAKIDYSGNFIWSNFRYDFENLGSFGRFYSVTEDSNNNLVASGWSNRTISNNVVPILATYTPSGQIVYEQMLFAIEEDIRAAAYANTVASNGDQFFLGFKSLNVPGFGFYDANSTSALIVKNDSNGNNLWEQSLGLGSSAGFYDCAASPDGGVVGLGQMFVAASRTTYVSKISGDGSTKTNFVLTPAFEYTISPNPTADLINIRLNKPAEELLQISIIDMQGKSVQLQSIQPGSILQQCSMTGLPASVYSVVVKGEKFQSSQMLVKQ